MNLTVIFSPLLPEGRQKAVAMDWLQRWQAGGGKEISPVTVESRLSDLKRERIDGVRFFYNDPARESLLAAVLELPPEVRVQARERAAQVLATGGTQAPRLVVDLCGLTRDSAQADALFKALKADLLGDSPLLPLVILVDEDQYDRLPRSFDDLKPRLAYEKVTGDPSRDRAMELAGETAVVASTWRFQPEGRWLALRWDGALHYGPPDGLDRIRDSGRLPGVTSPDHDAADLLDEGTPLPPVQIPTDPVLLRHTLCSLGDPARGPALGDVPTRVALARALGVRAASTEAERQATAARRERASVEAQLGALAARLGREVSPASPADLDRALSRASRVGGTVALRVGDAVHLVGPPDLEAPADPRLTVHRVPLKPTALSRLLAAADALTEDGWRDDPLLLNLVGRLAEGNAEERRLLLHARAGLMLSGALKPAAPEPLEDWRGAFQTVLAPEPPPALLRLEVEGDEMPWLRDILGLKPWAFPEGRVTPPEVRDIQPLGYVPPLCGGWLARGQRLLLTRPERCTYRKDRNDSTGRGPIEAVPSALVPIRPRLARDPETWLAFVEASPAFGASREAAQGLWERYQGHLVPGVDISTWKHEQLQTEALWPQADREVAMAWLALRRAARCADAIRMHDGRVLLDLGGGVLAQLDVRRHGAADAPVRAALELRITNAHRTPAIQDLTVRVDTHMASTPYGTGSFNTRLGYALPRRLTLLGRGLATDVGFVASPLLAAGGATLSTLAAGPLVAAIAAEKARDDD